MCQQVDLLPNTLAFVGTRAQMSSDKEASYADVVSQKIPLAEQNEKDVSERVCSVLSSVQRLPPFDYKMINGYSFINIRSHQEIIYFAARKMAIIPMLDPRVQMIVLPKSQVPKEMAAAAPDEVVKTLMKDINENNITKFNEICIPSFKIEVLNREIDSS